MSAPSTSGGTGTQRSAFTLVAPCLTSSLVLVIVGGIWMAGYFPRRPSLVVPAVLWVLSVALTVSAFALLAREREFSWSAFRLVGRWALLAYVLVSALIEYAFVHNGASGSPLALVTAMLVVFAVDVASVIAATVARYQAPPPAPGP